MKAKHLIKILENNPEWNVKIMDRFFGLCDIEKINTKQLPSGDCFIIESEK